MIQNKFGEMIFSESDLIDLIMQGRDSASLNNMIVDQTVNLENVATFLERVPVFINENLHHNETIDQFHKSCQQNWHMPDEYKTLDIAEYVLGLCKNEAELQRCGQELLLYQERDLFNLLRYLKYLIDTMTQHQLIWGVGRGSSVASYVLYKLGVHRIDSMFYELNIEEFLR